MGFLQELKDAFYEMGQPGDNTYDGKRKREVDKKWKSGLENSDQVLKTNIDRYNNLDKKYKNILNQTDSTTGDLDRNLNQYGSLINTGRLKNTRGNHSKELLDVNQSEELLDELELIRSLPAGVREVRPGDYDSRILTFEEMNTARKNKDFRDDITRDDYIVDPYGFLAQKQGNEEADSYYTEEADRYLNAETPKDYANLLARRSYDTPKALAGVAKELGSYYYKDGSIYKDDVSVQDKNKEAMGMLGNNLAGGAKLAGEYFGGYGARMLPVSPVDVYNMGIKEAWSGEDRNRAWGLYDNTIGPISGQTEEVPVNDLSYVAGWSDLMGGKEGAGTNPYFGYEKGFQPNKDLYNEKAFETHPMLKKIIIEEEINKAIEAGDTRQANKWQEMLDQNRFPSNIDYSKYNRLNIRRNLPSHVTGLLGGFLLPGTAGSTARKIGKVRGFTTAAGLAEKSMGLKGLGAAAVAGGAEGVSNKPRDQLEEEESDDFFDVSLYRN